MTHVQGVGPGTVLGGRYAVTFRTSEGVHHERWRASDHTLEREVVLVCFAADSSVAAAALDAARRAAGVEDARLVRVLDVGSDQGVGFIVEEPLTGALPMSHLLQSGGLPAREVRRLVGETASALERARHRGLHHLALTPSAVLRMPGGEVKIRGLATEAALLDTDPSSDEEAARDDATGLVRLTYAGLTGRWPASSGAASPTAAMVGLEAAPTIVGGFAAPSEITVGVPDDLDQICRMTLNDDRGPTSPGDLASQIAPWPSAPPETDGASGIDLPAGPDDDTSTRVMPPVSLGAADGEHREHGEHGVADDGGDASGAGAGRKAGSLAAAGAAAAGAAGALGDRVGSFARAAADKAAARSAERRGTRDAGDDGYPEDDEAYGGYDEAVDVAGPDAPATGVYGAAGASGAGAGRHGLHLSEALDEAPDSELEPPVPVFRAAAPDSPSKAQSRIALAIVGALVIVALVVGIQNVAKIGQSDGPSAGRTVTVTAPTSSSGAAPTTTTQAAPTTTTPAPPATPAPVTGVTSFDPQDDNTEGEGSAKLAIDGNPATAWESRWYGTPTYNGNKDGVGLVLDFAAPAVVSEVQLVLPAAQDVTVFLASKASLAGAQKIGAQAGANGAVVFKPTSPLQPGTKIIVWVTKAAPAEAANHYRAQVSEVTVR
ncbi:MAG: hypothetical protein ABIS35_06035 [Terracoccus sp.]